MVRGVLYTAITRARRLLILVGDDAVPGEMAANDRQQRRYSGLRRRLKEGHDTTVNESLDKAQKRLLDFFFPRKCPFCGRMTGRELLCSRCKTGLPRCDKLRTGSFGECAAPLYYEDNVRKAILDFKFKNRVENLNCFGL